MKSVRQVGCDVVSARRLPIKFLGIGVAGFSLVEMILVAAISSIVIVAAAAIAISETKASIKSYVLQGLRDKYARLSYFIESEVGEADNLRVADTAGCPAVAPAVGGVTSATVFLFSFRHRYIATDVNTCFYTVPLVNNPDADDPNDWAVYRFGPAFGNITGVIGGVAGTDDAIPAALNPGTYVVAPYALITLLSLNDAANCGTTGFQGVPDAIRFACDGRTLTYVLNVGTGSTGRNSIWNSTYSSDARTLVLRTRIR